MNNSMRWVMLVMIVGVIALGGLVMGCDNSQTNDENPTVDVTPTENGTAQNNTPTPSPTQAQENSTNEDVETTGEQTNTTETSDDQANTPLSEEDLIDVLIGDSLIDVDKVEIRQLEVSDNEEGVRLDDWLQKQAPEASRSIIRRWLRDDRVAVNNVLTTQASYPLAPADMVAFSFTEFSALRIHINEFLAKPAREEYDLFLLTITGKYIKDNHIQYLGVGPLFSNDIARVPDSMKGKNALPNWTRAFATAEFGEYRFYELE
jgi:ribosomal 50S subunit-recycling heat shock protein